MTLSEFALKVGLTRQRVHLLMQLGRIEPKPRMQKLGKVRLWKFADNARVTQPKGRQT
jgi:hypothetical protein